MKKNIILFLTLVFVVAVCITTTFGLTGCSKNNPTSEPTQSSTQKPEHSDNTDKSDSATDSSDNASENIGSLLFNTLSVNKDKVYGKVSNETDTFSFINEIKTEGLTKYIVSLDIYGNQQVATKTIPLNEGDNTVYVIEMLDDEPQAIYEVTIRRRLIYKVSFYTNNGTRIFDQQVEEDSYATMPNSPERRGYTFDKWNYDFSTPITKDTIIDAKWNIITYNISYNLNGGTLDGKNPTTYTVEDEITLIKPTKRGYNANWDNGGKIAKGSIGDKTFNATWNIITYNISYNLNGGTINGENPTTYTIEDEITLTNTPTKRGYNFANWDNGGKISKGSIGDKTFNANWTAIVYKISYNLNGGTIDGKNPTTYTVEDEITLIKPTKRGYSFTNWDNGSKIVKGSIGDKTFNANWTAIVYKISYNLNGGTINSENPTTYTVEDEITLTNTPTKRGYKATWDNGGKISKGSIGDKTFNANWEAVVYKISYNLNGGTIDGKNPTTYTVEDEITLINPTKRGYDFANWDNDGKIAKGSIGDKTFDATWNIITYSISYNLNGGTINGKNPTSYTVEDEITLTNTPTKRGYKATWDNGGKISKGSIGDKTFNANWEAVVYKISYNLNGGIIDGETPTTYTIEDEITLVNNPTKRGYNFANWDNGGRIAKGSIGDKTFNANWTAIFYKISYNLNGGTIDGENPTTYTVEDEITLANSPTKRGYNFANWDNGGKISKGSIGDITFNAKWDIIAYNISYNLNGGTIDGENPVTYTVEDEITLINPTKRGYNANWDNGGKITKGSIGDITFSATYSIIVYKITYDCGKGTNNTLNPLEYTIESETIILNDAYYINADFIEWQQNNIKVPEITKGSIGDVTLTAVWDEYDVKLQENGNYYTVIGLNTNKTDIEIKPSYKGKKLTTISDNAFKNCSKITSITIPNSVITIGDLAFAGCSGLTSVTVPDSITSIGDRVFTDCSELTSVIIGKSLSSIVSNSFSGCNKLTNITIGNGITSIGSYAFFGCSGLTNIYINDISAWCNISGLKNLMEDNSINKNLYLHEKLITDLIIPNNVTSIASNAFRNCTGITSVTIPDSVTSIGNSAFYNCKGLTSITIPNSVRTIEYYSFVNCNVLKMVYYKGTAAQWREISFELAGDSSLANAARYYYSKTEPALNSDGTAYDGNYWHYDSDGITPVIWKKEN